MKISELITELQKYDGNKEIYIWDWLQFEHVEIDAISLHNEDEKHSDVNPLGISVNNEVALFTALGKQF